MVQEGYPIEVQLMKFGFIYLGRRSVIRQGSRYIIYLPSDQKDLWRKLQGRKLRVWVKLEEDE
ncbi:MAG: hypothetical protein DRJ30_07565 [Candidatus Methanomethylicota archaeon]|nr:MAG: hypothetical protein DRJ30_07565 [Candidatus Verstraetearchaeota archaeon]